MGSIMFRRSIMFRLYCLYSVLGYWAMILGTVEVQQVDLGFGILLHI